MYSDLSVPDENLDSIESMGSVRQVYSSETHRGQCSVMVRQVLLPKIYHQPYDDLFHSASFLPPLYKHHTESPSQEQPFLRGRATSR